MEFRILGPLEVIANGHALDLGGQKQRALFAVLLLHANEVVSSDRLIEALWEQEPPDTAQKALQVYVSQLRKLVGRERLETKAPGYLLRVEQGELDLERFQQLHEQGSHAEALALWRGPPLAEFAYQRFAQPELARLEELRLVCLEERIEADLGSGRHAELVGELEALAQEHPHRQRLRAQIMLALYRSGRDAEALDVYQGTRRALVEELGIEPRRQLRELQQAILRQDPALDLVASSPAERDSAGGAFVGREAELAELIAGLDDAFAGRGSLFLIVGEPGIGKSRLADELIVRARARGARELVGRCWEAGGAPAYWPWVQSMRAYVRETEVGTLRAQLGAGTAALAQLLPELGNLFPDLGELPALESESARFRLFDAVSSFLLEAARERPLVLILDDLHAADEPSLLLLRFVARELAAGRLLVVGTYRDVDPVVREPLAATVAELAREPVTNRVHLGGLAEQDVADYIQLTTGESVTDLAGAIHAETDGNPLFVGEIVRLLAAEGRLAGASADRLGIPEGVRELIDRRVRRLGEDCLSVLVLASVFGREFGFRELARASGVGADDLAGRLEEALVERLLVDVPGAPGQLRFSHALVRDVLYERVPAPRRARLHSQVGDALETFYGPRPAAHLAELAHHFVEAAAGGDVARAVEYAQRAGDHALGQLAYEEAARLYRMALQALELEPDDEARAELLLAQGDAEMREGDSPAAKQRFQEVAELARNLGRAELLARAALGYGGRTVVHSAGSDRQLVELLEAALTALGDEPTPLRARLLARLAGALRDRPDREPRDALSAEAVEIARSAGDEPTLAYALDGRLGATWWPGRAQERLPLAAELIELAELIGDDERAFFGRGYRMYALLELGNMPGAYEELEARAAIAERLSEPALHWLVAANRGLRALLEGNFADAEKLIPTVRLLGARVQRRETGTAIRHQLVVLRRQQGRLAETTELLDSNQGALTWLRAYLDAELGNLPEARAAMTELAAGNFTALPSENDWLLSMCLLSEACYRMDEADHAATLHTLLEPFAGLNAVSAPEVSLGAVSRYLGLLATTMGHIDEAERHFEDALAMNANMGGRPWLAHTQHDYARMLLARDGPGDRERAQELLDQALAIYRELGMESYAATASKLVEKH